MGTLDRPDAGTVSIEGKEVFKQNDKTLAAFRNKSIGFIFQFHHLLPEFTAVENVCIPAYIHNEAKSKAEARAKELLEMLKLGHRFNHKPSELSGGEQQRVAVARALMNNPTLIMADEPSGNLDTNNARDLHKLFFELRDTLKQTFVIVTHNEELANMADRTVHMKDGLIVS
jgi:lipoprotein-releasing system ATP-binding protein